MLCGLPQQLHLQNRKRKHSQQQRRRPHRGALACISNNSSGSSIVAVNKHKKQRASRDDDDVDDSVGGIEFDVSDEDKENTPQRRHVTKQYASPQQQQQQARHLPQDFLSLRLGDYKIEHIAEPTHLSTSRHSDARDDVPDESPKNKSKPFRTVDSGFESQTTFATSISTTYSRHSSGVGAGGGGVYDVTNSSEQRQLVQAVVHKSPYKRAAVRLSTRNELSTSYLHNGQFNTAGQQRRRRRHNEQSVLSGSGARQVPAQLHDSDPLIDSTSFTAACSRQTDQHCISRAPVACGTNQQPTQVKTDEGRRTVDGRTTRNKPGFERRGCVRLSVSFSNDQLCVQILEARDLLSHWTDVCSSYVQVTVCPSSQSRLYDTHVCPRTNSPIFNQTLKLNLSAADMDERLLISVWHSDQNKRCSEFIGCLSFGLRKLITKISQRGHVTGWYHVLPQPIGHRKHLLADDTTVTSHQLCTGTQPQPTHNESSYKSASESRSGTVPAVCSRVSSVTSAGLKESRMTNGSPERDDTRTSRESTGGNYIYKTIVLRPSEQGWGFTLLHNTKPVRVGRVKPDSVTRRAGLHNADVIAAINQTPTLNLSAAEIASLIRASSSDGAVLEVICPHYSTSIQQYLSDHLMHPANTQPHHQAPNTNNRRDVISRDSQGRHAQRREQTYSVMKARTQQARAQQARAQQARAQSALKWQPDLSIISADKSAQCHMTSSSCRNDSYSAAITDASPYSDHSNDVSDARDQHNVAKLSYHSLSPASLSSTHSETSCTDNRKAYSTFSLATEAECACSAGCQGSASHRLKKRAVRRRTSAATRPSLRDDAHDAITPARTAADVTARTSRPLVPYEQTPRAPMTTATTAEVDASLSNSHRGNHKLSDNPNGSYLNYITDVEDTLCCSYVTVSEHSDAPVDTPTSLRASRLHAPNNSLATPTSLTSPTSPRANEHSLIFAIHSPLRKQKLNGSTGDTGSENDTGSDNDDADSIDEFWLICSPRSQERFVTNMVRCEERFVRTIQMGISKYLWPCRQLLDGKQFRVIFQNIEKLKALSEYLLHQIRETLHSGQPGQFHKLLDIYIEKLSVLLDSYATYRAGHSTALQCLTDNKLHNLDFQRYVETQQGVDPRVPLDDVLAFPLQHLQELVQDFSEIRTKFPDHQQLQTIVTELKQLLDGVELDETVNASSLAPSEQPDSDTSTNE